MPQTDTLSSYLTADEKAVTNCLLYYAVFSYPLRANELFENSAVTCSRAQFESLLEGLIRKGLMRRFGDFFLSAGAEDSQVTRRVHGNAGARDIMDTARRFSRKIASFPFVRGVFLSGALSKNYFDEKGDIDYFIVTEPNRLWVCRTLLILRYKIMQASRRKFWCVNYFISADSLEIPEKNSFTATELAHLLPTYNYQFYLSLMESNAWYRNYFPNKPLRDDKSCVSIRAGVFKRFLELLFSGWGSWLDSLLLKITCRHWRKKFPDMSDPDFDLQFRSRKNACKRHNTGYQDKVLTLWEEKKRACELRHGISLSY